jgi:hypothetical protein
MPDRKRACRFDLDGVLTQTGVGRAAARQQTLGACLRRHAGRAGPDSISFP